MLRAAHEEREPRACDMHSLTSEPTHRRCTVKPCGLLCTQSIRLTRFLLAAEPPQQRILVLAIEPSPSEEMLTISGADWFGRRAGTCRLHAIYMNQPCIYVGKVGETVKYGWARHPRQARSARRCAACVRAAARAPRAATLLPRRRAG